MSEDYYVDFDYYSSSKTASVGYTVFAAWPVEAYTSAGFTVPGDLEMVPGLASTISWSPIIKQNGAQLSVGTDRWGATQANILTNSFALDQWHHFTLHFQDGKMLSLIHI